jgi:hypothetical protein
MIFVILSRKSRNNKYPELNVILHFEEALQEDERSFDLALAYYLETQKPIPLRTLIRVKKVVKTAPSSS